MELAQFQEIFRPRFNQALEEKIEALARLTEDEFLLSIVRHTLELGKSGKRVRPMMIQLAFEAFGGEAEQDIWDALIGIELFHLFALVHDDVVDEAATRRGTMTTQVFVANQLQSRERNGSPRKVGESQAILLGDLLLSWAIEKLSIYNLATRQQFQKMIDEVVFGQMIDVDLSTQDLPSKELIDQKMFLKTASYSFIRPLLIGTALAGGSKEQINFCRRFGLALGMAFQIQDDYMDLTATEMQIKKPVFSDLRERQQTLFTRHIFEEGSEEDRERLIQLHGNPDLNESHREEIIDLFNSSGAIKYGKAEMKRYFDQAEDLARSAPTSEKFRTDLLRLVRFISKRVS